MKYAAVIERRIERRTCTRAEWHALRRWKSNRARGIPTPEIVLFGAIATADFRRAAEALLESYSRAFRLSSDRAARMRFGGLR